MGWTRILYNRFRLFQLNNFMDHKLWYLKYRISKHSYRQDPWNAPKSIWRMFFPFTIHMPSRAKYILRMIFWAFQGSSLRLYEIWIKNKRQIQTGSNRCKSFMWWMRCKRRWKSQAWFWKNWKTCSNGMCHRWKVSETMEYRRWMLFVRSCKFACLRSPSTS